MPIGGEIVLTQKAQGSAIPADVAVVQGTESDMVRLPAGTNERAKGVAALKADAPGRALPIVITGPAVGRAAEPVEAGQFVNIADARGYLKPVGGEPIGTMVEVVGLALTSAATEGDFDLVVVPFRYKA